MIGLLPAAAVPPALLGAFITTQLGREVFAGLFAALVVITGVYLIRRPPWPRRLAP